MRLLDDVEMLRADVRRPGTRKTESDAASGYHENVR
jgi:hypothetical protein